MKESDALKYFDKFMEGAGGLLWNEPIDSDEFTRAFIMWVYGDGGFIANKEESEKIDGMTIMAHVHGMNPFEKSGKK